MPAQSAVYAGFPESGGGEALPLKLGVWSITWTTEGRPPRIEEQEACSNWNAAAMFSLLDRPATRRTPLSMGFPVERHSATAFTVTAFQDFPGDRSFQTKHDVTMQGDTAFHDKATRIGMPGPAHVTGEGKWVRACPR